jgi:hypothetical protein
MTDHITIPRALLEQALANMVRAELLYGQPTQAIQEAIRAALSAPATAPDELERLRAESEERLQNCVALVAENEQLRKDAERFAWYENNSEKVLNIGPHWYSRKLYNMPMKRRNGFRNAIDAAMKGTP